MKKIIAPIAIAGLGLAVAIAGPQKQNAVNQQEQHDFPTNAATLPPLSDDTNTVKEPGSGATAQPEQEFPTNQPPRIHNDWPKEANQPPAG